jgi:hypothetical protein
LATVSALFEVTKSAAGRHKREHMSRVEVAPSGEHLQAADAMIEQARSTRTFDSYDEAEAVYLRTIAVALDARPENPSILSEFRRTLAGFRPEKPKPAATDEQWEFAQLVATLRGPLPGVYESVYQAVIANGGSEDAAWAAANTAVGNPDAIRWPGMVDGVPQGPLPTDAQIQAFEARRQAVLTRPR